MKSVSHGVMELKSYVAMELLGQETPAIKSFQDLVVWQKAHRMFLMACDDVEKFPNNRVAWSITGQLLDAVGSISANIAEGYGSGYHGEFIHSLKIARKENSEALNWLIKCRDRQLISPQRFDEYAKLSEEIRKMINSILNRLSKSS